MAKDLPPTIMLELLTYEFIQKSLIGGVLIGLICGMLGPFLILRRMALLGDGLAHIAFGGIAVGLLLGIGPLIAALIVAAIASVLIERLISKTRVQGDAAIGVMFSFGVAIAILIIGLVNGFTVDIFSYLIGSILTLSDQDILIVSIVFILTLAFILSRYRDLVFSSLHVDVARLSGVKVGMISVGFSLLTALGVVVSIRAVGILLVTALLIVPAITGLQISRSFKSCMWHSALISTVSVVIGILLSFLINAPTGSVIVLIMIAIFAVVYGISLITKKR